MPRKKDTRRDGKEGRENYIKGSPLDMHVHLYKLCKCVYVKCISGGARQEI
jgi:hypothetical protein